MKILWITNIPIGKHCEITKTSFASGGWLTAMLDMYRHNDSIDICVVTTWSINRKISLVDDNIQYVLIPGGLPLKYKEKKSKNLKNWRQLISEIKPDIIHIHGTEYSLGLSLMFACPNEKYIISIQGLCSVVARYYLAGINSCEIIRNITFRDLLRWDSMFQAKNKFYKRGINEIEYINRTKHVIGRTTWDHVHVNAINEHANYHFCNENLRDEFYKKEWTINSIERHSIFISQGNYPIKGLHMVFKAMNLLRRQFPDLRTYIAGYNLNLTMKISDKMKISGYSKYLRSLIKEYSLEDCIFYMGNLSSEQMAKQYKKSHVFVCPSSIENSPNSVGEAQLVGVPCIASHVGGIPDMIQHNVTGLIYQFEEFEMLAYYIKCIFNDDLLAIRLSNNEKEVALIRHNRVNNSSKLLEIYSKIRNV